MSKKKSYNPMRSLFNAINRVAWPQEKGPVQIDYWLLSEGGLYIQVGNDSFKVSLESITDDEFNTRWDTQNGVKANV